MKYLTTNKRIELELRQAQAQLVYTPIRSTSKIYFKASEPTITY